MTTPSLVTIGGSPVVVVPSEGPVFTTTGDATEVIGDAFAHEAQTIVIPVERLPDDFFELRTGYAGEVTQKFANYRLRLAIIGDIEPRLAESESLTAWVAESNRGSQLWFAPTLAEITERLEA